MTAKEELLYTKKLLEGAGVAEPEAKARIIVSYALNVDFLRVYSDIEVSESVQKKITAMIKRCINEEPVEYITGFAYFRYLTLEVNPSVLIPRKETELVAGKAIELIKQNSYRAALDMCTGSGCIAIAVATEANIPVTASDISKEALKVAKRNAETNGVFDISFINSNMFDDIENKYDIIVCNPPYVSEKEYTSLDDSVRLYEPRQALLAGDGLDFYRIIASEGLKRLNPGGAVVLEIGAMQAEDVSELLGKGGFAGIECMKDYAGRDRIVCARSI